MLSYERISAGGPGIGDAILLSAVAREIYQQRGVRPVVSSAYPELFAGNPYIGEAVPWDGARSFPELDDMRVCGDEHMVVFMCRKLGLEPPGRVQLFARVEGNHAFSEFRYVTVQSTAGAWAGNTKRWPLEKWRKLVSDVRDLGVYVVQIGGLTDPDIGCLSLCMGKPLPETLVMLADALCHVGPISGPMHLANAVGTRSVVIAGGREQRSVVGYPDDVWCESQIVCSPCWKLDCDVAVHGIAPCLEEISVEEVVEKVAQVIRNH
jgi:ADP-heptose:LPS heptosyltransferase